MRTGIDCEGTLVYKNSGQNWALLCILQPMLNSGSLISTPSAYCKLEFVCAHWTWLYISITFSPLRSSLVAQIVKSLPAMQENWVWSLSREDPLRREQQPTPLFFPGESHGQRSLVGYSPWGCKELAPIMKTGHELIVWSI